MKSKTKIRTQRRIEGGRIHVGSGVEKKLKITIEDLATKYKCTKSFVITYFLLKGLGHSIDKDEKL